MGKWGVLPLCRDAVSVFYSPSKLGQTCYCTYLQNDQDMAYPTDLNNNQISLISQVLGEEFPLIYTHTYIYEGESKSNAFFFSTGIITDTGTCIIHQNETGLVDHIPTSQHSYHFSQ